MKTRLKKTVLFSVLSIAFVFLQLFLTGYPKGSAKETGNNIKVETETIVEKILLSYLDPYDDWEITTTMTTTYSEDGSKIISTEAVSHSVDLEHKEYSSDKTVKTLYSEDGSRIVLVETDEAWNRIFTKTVKLKDVYNDDGSEFHTQEYIYIYPEGYPEEGGNVERSYIETKKKIRKDGAIVTVTAENEFLNDELITAKTTKETAFDEETSKQIVTYTSFTDDSSYKEATNYTPDGFKSIRRDPDGKFIRKNIYKKETFEDRTRTTEFTVFNYGLKYIHRKAEYTDGSFSEITKKSNPSTGYYFSEFERENPNGIIYYKKLNIEGNSGTYEHSIENENTDHCKTIKLLLKDGYAVLDEFDFSDDKSGKLPSSKVLHGKKYKIKEISSNCYQSDYNCELKSLDLGKYVTKISFQAFINLVDLKEITIRSKIRSVAFEIFPYNINKLTIKLPIKDLSAYNTEVERLKSVFDTCLCPKLKFVQVTD